MTRREEIAKQAEITVFPWDEPQEQNKFQDGFIEGAKWADKTRIEKICEWIEDNVENVFVCVNGIMTELNGIELSGCIHKAMEE